MKRFWVVICLLWAAALLAAPGDVMQSIPVPGHAPTGLAYDGKYLWLADRLTDTLYALDPSSGAVMQTLIAPGFDPSALAFDGNYLWCVDREENRISKVDPKRGLTVLSFESPVTGPQGLAWDGKALWLADDDKHQLSQISTDDGTTIVSYRAASGGTTGLTAWRGYLWCGDRRDDKVYLFDPEHGEVVLGLDAPGKYVRGLAAVGDMLWCVDYQDRMLYRIALEDTVSIRRSNPHTLNLDLTYEFRNYGPGEVPSLDAYIAVPGNLPNQKLLSEVKFSPAPTEMLKDRWQQPVAHFRLENLPLSQRKQITMTVQAELSDARQIVYPHKVGPLKDMPKDLKDAYLVDEDKYRIHDPVIVKATKEAVGDETNPYWMMRRIHKYIRDKLHYELSGGWNVAPQVLLRGNGSCSEYAFVFIAMCRAAGIPTRYVGSVAVRGDEASTDDVFHRWCQVYMPNYGWLHVDPSGGDSEKPADVANSIGVVANRFLLTTAGGGASEYLGWNYNYDQQWTSRGPVKVFTKAVGEWSPLKKDDPKLRTTTLDKPKSSGAQCSQ